MVYPERKSPPVPVLSNAGIHLLGEWHDCDADPPLLCDAGRLARFCRALVDEAGLTVVGVSSHQFRPQGATVAVLLAESHLAVHTWPEARFLTVDLYVCNATQDHTAQAEAIWSRLLKAFRPNRPLCTRLLRTQAARVSQAPIVQHAG